MEDALAQQIEVVKSLLPQVLILVLMEDALAQAKLITLGKDGELS